MRRKTKGICAGLAGLVVAGAVTLMATKPEEERGSRYPDFSKIGDVLNDPENIARYKKARMYRDKIILAIGKVIESQGKEYDSLSVSVAINNFEDKKSEPGKPYYNNQEFWEDIEQDRTEDDQDTIDEFLRFAGDGIYK